MPLPARSDDTPAPDWLAAYEALDSEDGASSAGSPITSKPSPGGLPLGCALAAFAFIVTVTILTAVLLVYVAWALTK